MPTGRTSDLPRAVERLGRRPVSGRFLEGGRRPTGRPSHRSMRRTPASRSFMNAAVVPSVVDCAWATGAARQRPENADGGPAHRTPSRSSGMMMHLCLQEAGAQVVTRPSRLAQPRVFRGEPSDGGHEVACPLARGYGAARQYVSNSASATVAVLIPSDVSITDMSSFAVTFTSRAPATSAPSSTTSNFSVRPFHCLPWA